MKIPKLSCPSTNHVDHNQKYYWSSSCNVNVDFTSISARKVKIKIYYYASTSNTAKCYPRKNSRENPYLDNK